MAAGDPTMERWLPKLPSNQTINAAEVGPNRSPDPIIFHLIQSSFLAKNQSLDHEEEKRPSDYRVSPQGEEPSRIPIDTSPILLAHVFLCHTQVHLSDMLAGIVGGQWDMGL